MLDEEITQAIKKATEGDSGAFRLIVITHQSLLYALAYRFLSNREEAEDAVQETFVRLWKNLSSYRNDVKLKTWLYRIMVNLCLDKLKSSRYKQQQIMVSIEDYKINKQDHSADHSLLQEEFNTLIQKAANELTPKQRAVFILRDLEELPVDEVCQLLSLSAGNVKSNLYYARKHMSEKLKTYYPSMYNQHTL